MPGHQTSEDLKAGRPQGELERKHMKEDTDLLKETIRKMKINTSKSSDWTENRIFLLSSQNQTTRKTDSGKVPKLGRWIHGKKYFGYDFATGKHVVLSPK